MKIILTICFSLFFLVGCNLLPKFQTPYIVSNPVLNGHHSLSGNFINSTHKRYWLSYEAALKAEGYIMQHGEQEGYRDKKIKKPGDFKTYDLILSKRQDEEQRRLINNQFFQEGYVYASSICMGYFQQADYTKSQRTFFRRGTGIASGLVAGVMGLAEVSAKTIGVTTIGFSALDTSLDAYDNSFLVSPQLGLLEKAILDNMHKIYKIEDRNNFNSVAEVVISLSKIANVCSQTGMQAFVDESLNEKIKKTQYDPNIIKNGVTNTLTESEDITKTNGASTK